MGPEFFQTRMGHEFYQGQVPQIIKALNRIGDNLEKLNENIEKMNKRAEDAEQRKASRKKINKAI